MSTLKVFYQLIESERIVNKRLLLFRLFATLILLQHLFLLEKNKRAKEKEHTHFFVLCYTQFFLLFFLVDVYILQQKKRALLVFKK